MLNEKQNLKPAHIQPLNIADVSKSACNHRFSKFDGKQWVCTKCGRPDPPR